ncbi:MAG: PQQ-dependent sugar dehydrogenase, partial [Caulobacterales bacterium]|nr:PQQ-dependent sugar dehydrogenase [Caulobacterales bacterium]
MNPPLLRPAALAAASALWALAPAPAQHAGGAHVFNDGLILPEGFRAQVVHEIGWESRELIIREDGDMFVSLSGKHEGDHVIGLRDADGDHVIDVTTSFLPVTTPADQKFPRVHIARHGAWLYAVTNEEVLRVPLPAGALEPTGPAEVVVASIPYQSSHRGRTITVGADGGLYVNIGSPSNACQEQASTRGSPGRDPCPQLDAHAGIFRWPADALNQPREAGERFASGIRNAIAQAWDPATNALYVAQMGRDRLDTLWPELFTTQQNAELPGEEFFRVEAGKHYGWPYCYWDPFKQRKVLAPEYGGDGDAVGRCEAFEDPLVSFPGHHSPSSIAFYHAEAFPERYRGGAFVALKGSWNRAPLPQGGFTVAFVPFRDGAPTGEWETFADGFKGFDQLFERRNAVYRPQYVAVHPDGALYILDNNQGRIWRVTYTGEPTPEDAILGERPASDRPLIAAASRGRGETLYLQYCAACHQSGGGGVPGEFPPLRGTDWVSGDTGRLIRSVLHGMEGPVVIAGEQYDEVMPGHAFLRDREL